MKVFANFEVWIDSPANPPASASPLVCPVQVYESPAGPARGKLELNIEAEEFRTQLSVVRSDGPALEQRKSFGRRLFKALFQEDVIQVWRDSLARAQPPEADGLRLRLWINVPQLASLPWELLHDDNFGGFLATIADVPVCRYLPVAEPPYLPAQQRLRILGVIERPRKLPEIPAKEKESLKAALQGLGNAVEYKILENASVAQIQNELQKDYHVLHFLGHGTAGKLALVAEDGQSGHFIDDQEFSQLFLGRRSLRLIVLNACHSSQPVEGGLFAGIGPALVQKRMPAVIAMQYPSVRLDTASRFSQAFYSTLANGLPVDFAVNEARQALSAGDLLAERDWSTPVLYMGTRSGNILNFHRGESDATKQVWQALHAIVQETGKSTLAGALVGLSQQFEEVTIWSNRLQEWLRFERYLRPVQIGIERLNDEVTRATRSLPVLSQDTIDSLQRTWELCQGDVSDLKSFGRMVRYISRTMPVPLESKPNPEVNSWFSELDRLEKGLKDTLSGNLIGVTAEPKMLLNELSKHCRGIRDYLRERSADCRNCLHSEAEVLGKLATLLHTQLRA